MLLSIKTAIILLGFFLCSFLKADIYFEGGPSFYDLLYVDPGNKENQQTFSRVQILKNITAWMNVYQSRGVNLFTLPILDSQGVILFDSSALKSVGFRYLQEVGDIVPLIIMEARKKNLAISIPLDELAHIIGKTKKYKEWLNPEKLTKDCIAEFIRELGIAFSAYSVTVCVYEQFFSPEYRQIIAQSCEKNGVLYIRYGGDKEGRGDIFYSEDYATFPFAPESKKEDAEYLLNLSQLGISYFRIGYHNMIFGLARTFRKKTGVLTTGAWGLSPGCQFNVALYRAVQFSPSYYSFFPAFYEKSPYEDAEDAKFIQNFHYEKHLLPYLKKFSPKNNQNTERPIANIILDIPSGSFDQSTRELIECSTSCSMEAITNAITASGMDLYVSARKPVEKADLYYIFTLGSYGPKNIACDVSEEVASIFPCGKKVFLHCVLGFPKGPQWSKISSWFGIPAQASLFMASKENPLLSPIPPNVSFVFPSGEFSVKWKGYQFWIRNLKEAGYLSSYHSINHIPKKDLSPDSEILLGYEGKETFLPLLIKNKNYFFVNSNFLHLDSSSILCNLIAKNPVFYSPAPIYLTVGENACALLAVEDSEIELFLPQAEGSPISHWNKNGKEKTTSTLSWNGKLLKGKIQKWELVVLENKEK